MKELIKLVVPDFDVPAGDIGVGGREIGYLLGQYKRLQGPMAGVLTGKPVAANGSKGRTEATGYGLVYFLNEMLKEAGQTMTGKKVMISGSGNVAFFAAKKVTELGGIVVTMSDSNHAIFNPNGINLDAIEELKVNGRERISRYQEFDAEAEIVEGSVWDLDVKADIALPCATQNEINQAQAERLVKNEIKMVAEGANMPSESDAIEVYRKNQIHYGPGKAANAGGVAVSALEMSQNSMRLKWTSERVDQELQQIMKNIFAQCVKARDTYDLGVDYGAAADIASFEQVAELMMIHGVI